MKAIFSKLNIFSINENSKIIEITTNDFDAKKGKYKGPLVNGKAQGIGVWKGKEDKDNLIYSGDFSNDNFNGHGTLVWGKDFMKWEGEWKDSMIIKGKKIGPGTSSYEGEFKNGLPHGNGISIGDVGKYVGEFKFGKHHGHGTFTSHEGDVYVGDYYEGRTHGQGSWRFKNGVTYEGGQRNGHRDGWGKFTDADGRVTEGYWFCGMFKGNSE